MNNQPVKVKIKGIDTDMKKLFGIIAIVAITTAAGLNFNQSKNEVELSDLALINILALASGESGGNKCATYYSGPFCGRYTNNSGSTINLYYP